ncbi:MAG: hypothetical protein RLZZ203_2447 [Cyanobacteriota bacterium]|jgi:hypothetical protein
MEIKKARKSPKSTEETIELTPTPIPPQSNGQFKAGVVHQASPKLMIPPAIQSKLSAISKAYNLPIDLSSISLETATPENVKALRNITELLTANSKLLPELMKLTAKLLKSDIKLAEFHTNLTKAAIKHQEKIDKSTADIWLAMAGYGAKSTKLEHRTNLRNSLIEQRTQAYSEYHQNSVYGSESKLLEVEYQLAASNRKILTESKQQRMETNADRKQKLQQYIDSAFA